MERSYLITMCLFVLHQIDAAYWKEWEIFYLSLLGSGATDRIGV